MGVQIPLLDPNFSFSGSVPRSGTGGSDSSSEIFLWTSILFSIFHSDSVVLHYHHHNQDPQLYHNGTPFVIPLLAYSNPLPCPWPLATTNMSISPGWPRTQSGSLPTQLLIKNSLCNTRLTNLSSLPGNEGVLEHGVFCAKTSKSQENQDACITP